MICSFKIRIKLSQIILAGSSELIIENSQLTDDDDYFCLAVNPAGRDISSMTLDVQRRPAIFNPSCVPTTKNNLCNANPIESGSLKLTCNATGDPKPTIRLAIVAFTIL